MKFSIGDPVYVVSNNEEGILTEFIGADMACVKVGTSIYHAYLSDLEHPYLRWFMKKNEKKVQIKHGFQLLPETKTVRKQSLADGLYLGFIPQFEWDGLDDFITKVKVFVFNETHQTLELNYCNLLQKSLHFQHKTVLKPLEEMYLHDLQFEEISTNPEFYLEVQDKADRKLYDEFQINLKPKKLFQFIDILRHDNKPIFHIPVFHELKPLPTKEVVVHTAENKRDLGTQPVFFDFEKAKKEQVYELDLHIEKLVNNWQVLANSTILHIQMTECQKALDLAISTRQQRMIIIHGMGKGRLRTQIHLLLNQTIGVHKFVCSYDVRYGYGATEVFFL